MSEHLSHTSLDLDPIVQAQETIQSALQSGLIIIYILGGPGSGKGSICYDIINDPTFTGFSHISIGEILREEASRPGSSDATLISQCMVEGNLLPWEILKKHLLLALAMRVSQGCSGLLVDGFPRKLGQAMEIDELYLPHVVLFLDCSPKTMLRRVMQRRAISSRIDDNEETMRKRLEGYSRDTLAVISHYEKLGKVTKVNSDSDFEETYSKVKALLESKIQRTNRGGITSADE